MGATGAPDIICVIAGQYVGIEVKAPKGERQNIRKSFKKSLKRAGGKYILAYSLEDVSRQLMIRGNPQISTGQRF
jgi:hypothetical protein